MTQRAQIQAEMREARLRTTLRPFVGRFAWVGAYFLTLLTVGTWGYTAIEGWSLSDSVFMAAITATAVGYGEVHALTDAGRVFTIALMAASIVGLGILWALITAMVVEFDLAGLFRRRRMMRRIQEQSDHFIVCGAGRMGRVVARELLRTGNSFVLIEQDPARVTGLLEEEPGLLFVEGDATREQVLHAAGIDRAHGLAACLPNDAENLFLVLTARGLKPDMEIVARAYDEESLEKLRRAGANHVISPAVTGAIRMASTLLRPSVVSFLDAATTLGPDISLRLEETEIPSGSHLIGKTLADAKIPQQTGLIVLALRCCGGDGKAIYNPGSDTRLSAKDVMIVLGEMDQVHKLREYVGT